jgi:cytochrome P450
MTTLDAIDLTDLACFEHGFPHDVFDLLRAEAPVFWHRPTRHTPDDEGFWVIARHVDVLAVFLDPATWSSEGGGGRERGGTFLEDTPFGGIMLNMMDDPRHKRIRSIVNRGFTPRIIGALEADLRRRAATIVEDVRARGGCDFVMDVARELPLQAICMLMGIPMADRKQLCDWIDVALEGGDRHDAATQAARAAASARIGEYATDLIAEKRARPGDDMLSVVVHATLPDEAAPRLGEDELVQFFFLLFTAGSETTRKAIAGGMRALIHDEPQRAWLRARREMPASAVEEIVRYTSPSVYKRRTATRDVTLHGRAIRAGDKVTVWEMSANRDERVFEAPHRFDLRRSPNPHLGFGQGVHYCLGANLARLEIKVLFEELLPRVDGIEESGDAVYTRDNRLFGLKRLPIRLRAA